MVSLQLLKTEEGFSHLSSLNSECVIDMKTYCWSFLDNSILNVIFIHLDGSIKIEACPALNWLSSQSNQNIKTFFFFFFFK